MWVVLIFTVLEIKFENLKIKTTVCQNRAFMALLAF